MIINGEKFACDTCVRGHRVAQCKHTDRPLRQISSKGRPVSQCDHCRSLRKTSSVHTRCKCASEALNLASGLARCRCFIGEGCTCAHSKKQPSLKESYQTDSVGTGSPVPESAGGTPRLLTTDSSINSPQTVPIQSHRPIAMKPTTAKSEDTKQSCCSSDVKKSCCSSNANKPCCSSNSKASCCSSDPKTPCCSSETVVPDTPGSCCSPTGQTQDLQTAPGHDFLINDVQPDLYNLAPPWPIPTSVESSLDPDMLALFDDTHLSINPSHSLDIFGPLSLSPQPEALGQGIDFNNMPLDWSSFEFQPTMIADIPQEENQQDHILPSLP